MVVAMTCWCHVSRKGGTYCIRFLIDANITDDLDEFAYDTKIVLFVFLFPLLPCFASPHFLFLEYLVLG